jgi:hypothetical protein
MMRLPARRAKDCEVAESRLRPPHGFSGSSAFQTGARRLCKPKEGCLIELRCGW